MSDYLVDILMPAYNQEKFIRDALDGVVMQQTSFDFRLVIGEDFSTDKTRTIVEEYVRKYPNIIDAHYREKNLGAYGNSGLLFKEMKAKYIAICEGDDYWIDPLKLQKQVDFMESNPDFAICYHLVDILNSDGHLERETLNTLPEPQTYTLADLAKGNFIHTPSVLFRNGLIGEFPEWFTKCAAADYVMHMLNASRGKIYYIPEVMAVYRIHSAGMWSNSGLIFKTEKWAEMLGYLIEHFRDRPEVYEILSSKYAQHLNWLSELYADEKNYLTSSNYLIRALQVSEEYSSRWAREYYELRASNQLLRTEIQNIKQRFLSRLVRVIKNPGLVTKKIFSKSTKKIRVV